MRLFSSKLCKESIKLFIIGFEPPHWHMMTDTYAALRAFIHQPLFASFRTIFLEHEWIFRLVCHEKSLPGPISETRVIRSERGVKLSGGYLSDVSMPHHEYYYPGHFVPFEVIGIWLPLDTGYCFSALPKEESYPFIQQRQGQWQVLFLIHPASKSLYQQLLEDHAEEVFFLSALSLSSVRSLLVALPDTQGHPQPIFAKLSLDQYSNGVHRVLSPRECALSVANTIVLKQRLASIRTSQGDALPLEIFEDVLGYVPPNHPYGMLYRLPPSSLDDTQSLTYTLPLLALYGSKNLPQFKHLVQRNSEQQNVTTFFVKAIFDPYIAMCMALLREKISLEAHGQNLMLKLNAQDKMIGFMYRDMAGVNQDLRSYQQSLPNNLCDPTLSYFSSFQEDASAAFEYGWIGKALFPFTKQLVQSAEYFARYDPEFADWYQRMQTGPWIYLKNWTTGLEDAHHEVLLPQEFYRYGYVETLFGLRLLSYLEAQHILPHKMLTVVKRALLTEETAADGTRMPPCRSGPIFMPLIAEHHSKLKAARKYSLC